MQVFSKAEKYLPHEWTNQPIRVKKNNYNNLMMMMMMMMIIIIIIMVIVIVIINLNFYNIIS